MKGSQRNVSSSTAQIVDRVQRRIFVFGSNLQGIHGKGAALHARSHHGAIPGKGEGHWGWSYALPTRFLCAGRMTTLSLAKIEMHIDIFIEYASAHFDYVFNVTRIGCGHAGYTDNQIAPLFDGSPNNVLLPQEWLRCPCCGGSLNLEDDDFKEAAVKLENPWKESSTPV